MSEEEKKAIKKLKEYALCKVNDNGYVEVSANGYKHTILNLIENQQKELNNLKEIEKSHQEENGKLRVELEKQKETNKAFHHFITFNGGKDIEDVTATKYMQIRQEGYIEGRHDEQQKTKEIIIKKLQELENKSGGNTYHVQAMINAEKNILKELLEEK